jgi:hypothetical protein
MSATGWYWAGGLAVGLGLWYANSCRGFGSSVVQLPAFPGCGTAASTSGVSTSGIVTGGTSPVSSSTATAQLTSYVTPPIQCPTGYTPVLINGSWACQYTGYGGTGTTSGTSTSGTPPTTTSPPTSGSGTSPPGSGPIRYPRQPGPPPRSPKPLPTAPQRQVAAQFISSTPQGLGGIGGASSHTGLQLVSAGGAPTGRAKTPSRPVQHPQPQGAPVHRVATRYVGTSGPHGGVHLVPVSTPAHPAASARQHAARNARKRGTVTVVGRTTLL